MIKDGTYWAEMLRTKKISWAELAAQIQKNVEQINPQINALAEFDFELAQKTYRQSEEIEERPFSGLPLPLKMLGQSKKGMGSSSGSRLFAGHRSSLTDNFVQCLEKAGFVPLGKTIAPEFGFKNVTDPVLYGTARNPWDLSRHAGGSSGGAAAAVAAGLFPIAGASDGGGSIRIPASFCGLIGLKPTRGSIPAGPDGWRGWQGASINFALTVSMRDTASLFETIRGTAKAAPYQAPFYQAGGHYYSGAGKKLNIAYCTSSPVHTHVSDEAKKAVLNAVAFLKTQGHEVKEIPYPLDGIPLIQSYYAMNGAETAAMFEGIEKHIKRKAVYDDMEPMTWTIYHYGTKIPASEYISALNLWDNAAAEMEQLFEGADLFLTPTVADTAPRIAEDLQSDSIRRRMAQSESLSKAELETLVYEMFEKSLAITPFTQLANLTGQPAISLPTHITPGGLPIGIQFMASKGREDLLFQAGSEFERQNLFQLPNYYREK